MAVVASQTAPGASSGGKDNAGLLLTTSTTSEMVSQSISSACYDVRFLNELELSVMGSFDVGSTDVGSTDVGSIDVGSTDVGSTDVGSTDVGFYAAGKLFAILLTAALAYLHFVFAGASC